MTGDRQKIINFLLSEDADIVWDIRKHRERRSLDSNAYAWCLIGKIADVLRAGKDEIYLSCLKKYGQSAIVTVLSEINVSGYFKYYDQLSSGMMNGKNYTAYKVYRGSSEYNTREMSIFIDGVISECKELEIETLPPDEIERMKNAWQR